MSSKPAAPASNAAEPCKVCGEETGVGSPFFSDRRTLTQADGGHFHVCSACQQRLGSNGRQRLTDAELDRAITTMGLAGQAWGGHPN